MCTIPSCICCASYQAVAGQHTCTMHACMALGALSWLCLILPASCMQLKAQAAGATRSVGTLHAACVQCLNTSGAPRCCCCTVPPLPHHFYIAHHNPGGTAPSYLMIPHHAALTLLLLLPPGFEKPSAIQQKGIVPFTKNLDVIQQAQSGTGKTATFCAGADQVGRLLYSSIEAAAAWQRQQQRYVVGKTATFCAGAACGRAGM